MLLKQSRKLKEHVVTTQIVPAFYFTGSSEFSPKVWNVRCLGFILPTTIFASNYQPSMNHILFALQLKACLLCVIHSRVFNMNELVACFLDSFSWFRFLPRLIFLLPENLISLLFTILTNEEESQHEVNINPAATLPRWPPQASHALPISHCSAESWSLAAAAFFFSFLF